MTGVSLEPGISSDLSLWKPQLSKVRTPNKCWKYIAVDDGIS